MYDPNLGITYHEKKGGDFAYMDPEEELYYKKGRAGWIPTHQDKLVRLERNKKLHLKQLKEYEDAYQNISWNELLKTQMMADIEIVNNLSKKLGLSEIKVLEDEMPE